MNIAQAEKRFSDLLANPAIKKRVEVHKNIIVHTRGIFPAKFVHALRPHRDKFEFDYIKKIYQSITQAGINRGINSLHLIFSNSEFSINNLDDKMAKLLEETLFDAKSERLSFDDLYSNYFLRLMIEDPNGGILWLPVHSTTEFIEDFREALPVFGDTSQRLDATPKYINSADVIHNDKDLLVARGGNYVYGLGSEDGIVIDKTNVEFIQSAKGKLKPLKAPYYWFVSKSEIHIYLPIKKNVNDGTITYELFPYAGIKNEGIPFDLFRGDFSTDIDDNCVFQSYFSSYIPFGNEAIRLFILYLLNTNKHGFIIRELEYIECEVCNGTGSTKGVYDGDELLEAPSQCTVCHGKKRRIDFTELGDIIKPRRRNADPLASDGGGAAIGYNVAPTDILRFTQEAYEIALAKAEESINVRKQNLTNQSEGSKKFDREYFEAMLKKIGDNYWRLYGRGLVHWANYQDLKNPTIKKPSSYDIENEESKAESIKMFAESDAPQYLINEKIVSLAQTVSDDAVSKKIITVAQDNDPLFGYSPSTYPSLMSLQYFAPDDFGKTITLIQRLNKVAKDKGDSFLAMSEDDIMAAADLLFTPLQASLLDGLEKN